MDGMKDPLFILFYFICFAMYMNTIITRNWGNKTENTNVTKKKKKKKKE